MSVCLLAEVAVGCKGIPTFVNEDSFMECVGFGGRGEADDC